MAMTKKEQAAYEEALDEIRILSALRWTTRVERDVLPPHPMDAIKYTNGWNFNSHAVRVFKVWSSSIYHGEGWVEDGKEIPRNASQQPQRLYSSELKAWQAMRQELEWKYARELAAIDKQIFTLTHTPTEE